LARVAVDEQQTTLFNAQESAAAVFLLYSRPVSLPCYDGVLVLPLLCVVLRWLLLPQAVPLECLLQT
jgi:hypothetical protein